MKTSANKTSILLNLSEDLADEFKKLASTKELNVSATIRLAMMEYLERHANKGQAQHLTAR